MKLYCYKTHPTIDEHLPIYPARMERQWMDDAPARFPYRCIPMTAMNSLGWEMRVKERFSATWNGNQDLGAITFKGNFPEGGHPWQASSHFGVGVVTFHTGYVFKTEPGWGVVCRGPPNWPKDGIAPLDGYIETDWLPFTFTMNWKFTRPGTVTFEEGEPFVHLSVIRADAIEETQPVIADLASNKQLSEEFEAWKNSRIEINARIATKPDPTGRNDWQKFYVQGKTATGAEAADNHKSKRQTKTPVNE